MNSFKICFKCLGFNWCLTHVKGMFVDEEMSLSFLPFFGANFCGFHNACPISYQTQGPPTFFGIFKPQSEVQVFFRSYLVPQFMSMSQLRSLANKNQSIIERKSLFEKLISATQLVHLCTQKVFEKRGSTSSLVMHRCSVVQLCTCAPPKVIGVYITPYPPSSSTLHSFSSIKDSQTALVHQIKCALCLLPPSALHTHNKKHIDKHQKQVRISTPTQVH